MEGAEENWTSNISILYAFIYVISALVIRGFVWHLYFSLQNLVRCDCNAPVYWNETSVFADSWQLNLHVLVLERKIFEFEIKLDKKYVHILHMYKWHE